jgi:hypothetical protein
MLPEWVPGQASCHTLDHLMGAVVVSANLPHALRMAKSDLLHNKLVRFFDLRPDIASWSLSSPTNK